VLGTHAAEWKRSVSCPMCPIIADSLPGWFNSSKLVWDPRAGWHASAIVERLNKEIKGEIAEYG